MARRRAYRLDMGEVRNFVRAAGGGPNHHLPLLLSATSSRQTII